VSIEHTSEKGCHTVAK